MAYVTDGHDPSGLGMFSKAGRFTSEKYIIFQRKDEILYNKKRVLKVSSYPTLGNEHKANDQGGKNFEALEKKKELEKERLNIKKEENQPFNKQLSRESIQKVKSVKNPPKPVGYYHPRYVELDKKPHMIWNILDVHKKLVPKKQFVKEAPTEEELYEPLPDKAQEKVKGLIELNRSLSRGNCLINQKNNPHEERFKKVHLSMTWSNMKRVPSFNMLKTMGREDNKIYENKEFAPDYNPNYEFGRTGLGSCGPPIHKIPSRKPFHKTGLTQNEEFFNYDEYKSHSHIFPNATTPDFHKYLPRERDPNSPLPSFMQKFVNSRTQLTGLSHKMLEQNHYMDGRFQSTDSQFKPAEKSKARDDEEDSQDSIVYDNQS